MSYRSRVKRRRSLFCCFALRLQVPGAVVKDHASKLKAERGLSVFDCPSICHAAISGTLCWWRPSCTNTLDFVGEAVDLVLHPHEAQTAYSLIAEET